MHLKPLVFHIRASNFFGGPERQIIGHIKTSDQFEHLIITFQEGCIENDFQQIATSKGVNVTCIKTSHSYQWSSIQQLRSQIFRKKPALICCHGYKPLALSILAKWGIGTPIIAFARGHTSENLKIRLFESIERRLYAFTDKIVSVSKGYADILKQNGVQEKKIEIILNAVHSEKFLPYIAERRLTRKNLGFPDNAFLIATAGRLSPEKAQEVLLQAYAHLKNNHEHIRLIVCGDGPLRDKLEQNIVDFGCRDVTFLGHRNDLDRLMPSFDLFVLPSLTEGLPNVLLEAASCMVPIIATRVGGVPEIIADGDSGLLIEPNNIDQLERAMEQCLVKTKMRTEIARVAFQSVKNKFNFSTQTQKLENLYRQVLTTNNHA